MHVVEKEFMNFMKDKNPSKFFVAYSGGVDSQVLLHLSSKYLSKTTALHVNHGISDNAFDWESFCEKSAKDKGIDFKVAHFQLKEEKSNLEEKARILRHGFFEENATENTMLMTGHHLDDQAETFMLRLMRGSGVDGLSSMASSRPMKNGGTLIRPLLNVSKEEIVEYAKQESLNWVEDESNQSSDYDRNFIRNEVMPLLKTRWQSANKSIANSANHCSIVKKEQEKKDKFDFEEAVDNNKLDVKKLESMSEEKQKRVIRFWLKENNQQMLDKKALNVLLKEVAFSRNDSKSCFKNKNYEVRKSFGFLYFIPSDSIISFNAPKGAVETSDNLKMKYNGMMKTKKAILKEEKIPYWERTFYKTFVNDSGMVVAIGNIKAHN